MRRLFRLDVWAARRAQGQLASILAAAEADGEFDRDRAVAAVRRLRTAVHRAVENAGEDRSVA